jgi:hypothetical protein
MYPLARFVIVFEYWVRPSLLWCTALLTRGYPVYRGLKQRGFSVVNSDGGFKSVETLQTIPSDSGSKVT